MYFAVLSILGFISIYVDRDPHDRCLYCSYAVTFVWNSSRWSPTLLRLPRVLGIRGDPDIGNRLSTSNGFNFITKFQLYKFYAISGNSH